MDGEKCSGEVLNDELRKFETDTFNIIMDTVIASMKKRFFKKFELCKDVAVLDTKNFNEFTNNV